VGGSLGVVFGMIGLDVQITFPQSHNPIAMSIIILALQRFARKTTFSARRLHLHHHPNETDTNLTTPLQCRNMGLHGWLRSDFAAAALTRAI
jgi:UDP-N-acetylmuramyl pentapeptide phosphotransferase/UDP-N-acetylglucosamine-1-phosphate transferase